MPSGSGIGEVIVIVPQRHLCSNRNDSMVKAAFLRLLLVEYLHPNERYFQSMSMQTTMEKPAESPQKSQASVQLKRQVTVKTKVTDVFRARAKDDLNNELKLIDTQLQQLEAQYQYSLQQLEKVAQQGQNVQQQLQQLNQDAQQKRNQLASLKMQVSSEIGNLDKIENGKYIVTGMLENMVEIRVGENIYDRLQNAEILVEDGIVTSISS